MKNTPAALKWLAEKRARMAGELRSAEQVSRCIHEDRDELRQELETLERLLAAAEQKQARLIKELAALDQVVVLYDEGINPILIEPVNGWQGHYGNRGALREFLVATIKSRSPEFITSKELEILTISEFSLVFGHRDIRMKWYRGSFKNAVKTLAAQGFIERGPTQCAGSPELGKWRWKQEVAPTLKELRESAASQGSGPG